MNVTVLVDGVRGIELTIGDVRSRRMLSDP
jgi:hypothetical protein